ncbi:MAG: helix-hairpin-helix domain-containing protein [candidate division KSB1 bacterium]|nr:helix-hairpin-helix domain-containing protein [candidate division KSB1 bacterium]MDZ7304093.1 helix-hairpin-helix domain-containing protein [candidate division KSB1 bacterium]MDZ7312073.1 helix-hairpin-helix domain-containing protein [candidate division KSB1 bacterium]
MWGFTRQEQRAILFLLSAFGIGSLVWLYRHHRPLPAVNQAEMAAFDQYAGLLQRDTILASSQTAEQNLSEQSREQRPFAPVDLNAATYKELLQLPGIGPVLAKRIVEYRQVNGPFMRLQDLRKVKGIGAKTYEKLAPLLTVK